MENTYTNGFEVINYNTGFRDVNNDMIEVGDIVEFIYTYTPKYDNAKPVTNLLSGSVLYRDREYIISTKYDGAFGLKYINFNRHKLQIVQKRTK